MKVLSKLLAATACLVSAAAFAGPVNINTADEAMLAKELTGVGSVKAKAIVEYRKANGPFKSAEDLGKVDGIGDALLAQNKDNIKLKD